MEKSHLNKVVLLVFMTILLLLPLSFLPDGGSLFGLNFKKVDIISDLKVEDKEEEENEYDYNYEYNFEDESYLLTERENVLMAGFSFFGLFSNNDFRTRDVLNYSAKAETKDIPIQGNVDQMKHFFQALKNAKRDQVRIGHFGDSIIGGDLITMDLRQNLQKVFGGSSVGFMRLTSEDIKFRMTTKHTFSDNWKTVEYSRNIKKLPVGIAGEVYIPKSAAWVEYEITPHYPDLNGYRTVKIFYSDAKASSIKYSFDGGAAESVALEEGSDLKEVVVNAPAVAKKVRIEFPMAEQAYFYGVSLENGGGIYVDNLSFQGQTGEQLQKIDPSMLSQFNKYLGYDLVIFQFGLNVIDKIGKDPKGYETEMVKVINEFKKAMPGTSFLLVGVNDKGFKQGSRITTDPNVLTLLAVQQAITKKTDIAFWNLFEAMGGKESMENWVKANPPLASIDYTHFNDQGAHLVSQMLSDALIKCYRENGK